MSNPSTYATKPAASNGGTPSSPVGGVNRPWDPAERAEVLARIHAEIAGGARQVKVPIRFSVEYMTQKLTEVRVRRPVVEDIFESGTGDGDDSKSQLRLLTRLTELPPDVLLSLDLADWNMLGRVLGGFS